MAKKSKKDQPRSVVAEVVDDDIITPLQESADDEIEVLEIKSDDRRGLVPAPKPSRGITNTDPLSMYLSEVRKYPLLTRGQEFDLAKNILKPKIPPPHKLW